MKYLNNSNFEKLPVFLSGERKKIEKKTIHN